jgi:hypothetical protein
MTRNHRYTVALYCDLYVMLLFTLNFRRIIASRHAKTEAARRAANIIHLERNIAGFNSPDFLVNDNVQEACFST